MIKILLKGFTHKNRLIYDILKRYVKENYYKESLVNPFGKPLEITVDKTTDSNDLENFNYIFSEFPLKTEYKMISYVSEKTNVEELLKQIARWFSLRCNLVACAKNEERYIEDWCLWYFLLGIDKVTIYDNNDDSKKGVLENLLRNSSKLKPFKNRIEVISWKGRQDEAYEHYWKTHDFDWLTINDVDEFIDLNGFADNIKELLSRYNSNKVLSLRCFEYGDNNIIERSKEDELKPVWKVFTRMNLRNYENFFKSSFNKHLITKFGTNSGHLLKDYPFECLTIDWMCISRNRLNFRCFDKLAPKEPFIRHIRTYSLKEYCQQKLNVHHQFNGGDIRRRLFSLYYYKTNQRTPEKDEFIRKWRKEHSQNYLILTTKKSFKEFFRNTFCYVIENDDIKIARMKRNNIFGGFCNLMMLLEEMDYVIFVQE